MIRSFTILFPYFSQQRWRLLTIVALSLLLSMVALIQPWPMKVLVDNALSGRHDPAGMQPITIIWLAAAATFGLFLINAALDVALSWAWMAAGQRMVYDLATDAFEKLLSVPSVKQQRTVGDNLERLSNDTWCVYTVASDLLVSPLQNTFTLIGIGIVAWRLDPRLAAVSFITAPVVAGSVWWFGPKLKRRAKQGREIQSRLTSFVHQTVTSIPLVQAFGAETRNQEHFESLADDAVTVAQRGVLVNKSFALVNGFASAASRAVVLFVGGVQVLQGNLLVGSLLVFMSYVRTMQAACENLLKIYAKMKTSEASIDRLVEILRDDVNVVRSGELPLATQDDGISIRFKNVSYAYSPGKIALQDVSFAIKPGEHIAIVGASGAGKSTLISLILRLIDSNSGVIEINDVDIRSFNLDELRSRIAVLLQEPYLLRGTIADNIAIGKPGARRDEICTAAEAAEAAEFINQLPNTYDTVIAERGVTLSGGQKQRIAIARAFVRNAALIVLDEPTSALDSATERELMNSFRRLTAGRTSIVVSHRLSTVRDVDRVIVLDNGRLVESGTPAELLMKRGYYHRFHQTAFGSETNGEDAA